MGNDLGKLEPPSFGFRRRRRERTPGTGEAAGDPAATVPAAPTKPAAPEPSEPVEQPVEQQPAEPARRPAPAVPAVQAARDTEQSAARSARKPWRKPATPPAARTPKTPAPADPAGAEEQDAARPVKRVRLGTLTASRPATRTDDPVTPRSNGRTHDSAADPEKETGTERSPWLTGHAAAAATGLGVGLFLVAAITVVERLSQATRGTSSLGRAGIPLLIAVFAAAVLLGSQALRACRVPSPGSISFLGTGLVVVIAVFFFTDAIATVGGGVAIVVIATASFVLSRWVTVTYLD